MERRTTSSSASPEQSHRELANTTANEVNSQVQQQNIHRRASLPKGGIRSQEHHYASDLASSNGAWIDQAAGTKLDFAYSTPSAYSFPEFSTTDYLPDEFNSSTYSRMPVMYPGTNFSHEQLQSMAPSLSSVIASENYKPDRYISNEMLTPFNLSYASLAGFSMPTTQDQSGFASRVNDPDFLNVYPYRPRSHSSGV